MDWFNPMAPVGPTQGDPYGQVSAARSRKLADALRKQSEKEPAQGSMVSGHYVAPSWSQHLSGLASQLGAGYTENKAQEAETASAGKIAEARKEWMGGLPQAKAAVMGTPTLEGLGGREKMGEAPVVTPALPLTHQRVMEHYLKGAEIPGNEKTAEGYLKGAQADFAREDTQTATKEAKALAATERAEREQRERDSQMAMLQERLREQGLSREERERHSKTMETLIAQNNAANQGLRAQGLDIQRGQIEAKAATAKEKADKKLNEIRSSESGLSDAIAALDKVKPNSAARAWAEGAVQSVIPGGESIIAETRDKAMNDAIQQVTYWTGEIQHDRFGSALTVSEKASAAQYLPTPFDKIGRVKEKAQGLQRLLKLNADRLAGRAAMPKELGGPEGTPTTASSGPITQAPAATVTKIINGKTYVQQNGKWFEQ